VEVQPLSAAEPFTTADGSTIRELHHTGAQSLAEATLEPRQATQRHYHRASEEIYFLLEGTGEMALGGERRDVGPGDAVLIPAGAWHQLHAGDARVRLLCCCVPPYSHEDTFFE
jgi:mannose-6-phosphate isomerase-like protein (cupin superfamily)